ncbi:MAG: AAA family ATPase [Gemmatimonadota bacterium]
MSDQAAQLRAIMAATRANTRSHDPVTPAGPPAIVVGSGKGGVGKSVVSVLLAAQLVEQGRRVLLVDGDQNLGSLHVLLGVRPVARLEEMLNDSIAPRDMLQPVGERLWLLPADSGAESLYAMGSVDRARLHHRLSTVYDGFDAVIIDAGPGIESVVRVSTMRATRLVVVTVPEPAALTDAYALIKIVNLQVPELPIDILANRAMDEAEGRACYERLATAADRFLRREVRYLGTLVEDESVRMAVREPGRLLTGVKSGPVAEEMAAIAADRFELPALAGSARLTGGH